MASPPRAAWLVGGLGPAQLVAWGTLYYGIAVLGEPMRAELGLTAGHVFGAFAWSLVISGALAPRVGRMLDRVGGRAVLVTSVLVGAVAFLVLARARSFPELIVGWSIGGLAMALGLYDTCFAAIGQVIPDNYRRTVTGVTLVAGFASTVSWPATHYLARALGWRATCDVYAVALLVCAPLYALVLPAAVSAPSASEPEEASVAVEVSRALRRRARLLAWAFAGTAVIGASLSAHLVVVLEALPLASDQAVWIAASIGAMQVAGRVLELLFGVHLDAVRLGFVTFVGLLVAMLLLLSASVFSPIVFAFALVYGMANGLLTIARATLPIEMFGLGNVGAVLGSFSAPSLITRALAPFGFALALEALGSSGAVAGLVAVGLASCVAYVATTRSPGRATDAPSP